MPFFVCCDYELGVAYKRAAGVFSGNKSIPGFLDYVMSGNCEIYNTFSIYGFVDLSKKAHAEKS